MFGVSTLIKMLKSGTAVICASYLVLSGCSSEVPSESKAQPQVLVFSKTMGWRHKSIETGQEALVKLGIEKGFAVTVSEDSSLFTAEKLKKFGTIVFLNTTGDIFNAEQQAAMEGYIRSGGGFVGIHSATDTEWQENTWDWYQELVGATFLSHPSDSNVRQGKLSVVNTDHPSTKSIATEFNFTDEWYDYRYINEARTDLITIDQPSYDSSLKNPAHPVSWYHEFDGGRSFYTNMGHRNESFSDALFLEHIAGGIAYALGENSKLIH